MLLNLVRGTSKLLYIFRKLFSRFPLLRFFTYSSRFLLPSYICYVDLLGMSAHNAEEVNSQEGHT
jgi:hypothetical protein